MATYYFHLCDGADVLLDPDGRELDGRSVEATALAEARAIIAADVLSGRIGLDQSIEVKDSHGKIVHSVDFADAVEIVKAGR